MTPERAQELAAQLGLDKVPALRYEEAPDENVPIGVLINFRKSVMLVDRLRTAAFEPYIPDICVIDQEMDAASYCEGMSDARLIRTDVPPPVDPEKAINRKVSRATGIPFRRDDKSYFIWLGQELRTLYLAYGASRMAPPLVFAGRGDGRSPGARPFIGIICKFSRRPSDKPADWGAIIPPGVSIKPENRRLVDNRSSITEKE